MGIERDGCGNMGKVMRQDGESIRVPNEGDNQWDGNGGREDERSRGGNGGERARSGLRRREGMKGCGGKGGGRTVGGEGVKHWSMEEK